MNKTEFLLEIKEIKKSAESPVNAKELIALYPYFMLAQLIQAKKEPLHLFNLNVLFPNRQYLQTFFTKNEEKPCSEIASKEPNTHQILQERMLELSKKPETIEVEKKDEDIVSVLKEDNISIDELIEKFNANHPKISCYFDESEEDEMYEDLCKNSVAEKMNIISETLANVYIEQGNYDKAIKIYKALIVKYPEKSSTFVNLIEELKEKKNSQKI